MRKFHLLALALCASLAAYADGSGATVMTVPSPAVSNKALEVKIQTDDFGSEVYCYTWCKEVNGKEKEPSWKWNDVHTDKFRMSGSGGTYTFKISNIKEFYELTDTELAGLTKIGFIAKTSSGRQTQDCVIEVVQGRDNAYSGGEGSASNPFILKKADDLQELSATSMDWASDVYLKLEADLDASGLTMPIGSKGSPFKAHFDGNKHSINNLTLTSTTLGEATGLFGAIDGAEIKDLGVVNAKVSGTTFVGALTGYALSGNIQRCFVTGNVTGTSICVGGLVGENAGATLCDCYANVSVKNSNDYATGGFVGKNLGIIVNTYASGELTAYDYAGGLVGANYGHISQSIALNPRINASLDYVARFGGNNNSRNNVEGNCSWAGMGNPNWSQHGDHADTYGTEVLKDPAEFTSLMGWDFDNVWEWKTENNHQYPALRGLPNQTNTLSPEFYLNSGVSEVSADAKISVGPNPTCGEISVSSGETLAGVAIFSLDGRCLAQPACQGANHATVDLTGVPAGLYLLKVLTAEGKNSTFKIIKK